MLCLDHFRKQDWTCSLVVNNYQHDKTVLATWLSMYARADFFPLGSLADWTWHYFFFFFSIDWLSAWLASLSTHGQRGPSKGRCSSCCWCQMTICQWQTTAAIWDAAVTFQTAASWHCPNPSTVVASELRHARIRLKTRVFAGTPCYLSTATRDSLNVIGLV